MKLIQGCCYTVPGASLNIYVRKIKYTSLLYTDACIEFVRKGKNWSVFETIKNARLVHSQISHWERVKHENSSN